MKKFLCVFLLLLVAVACPFSTPVYAESEGDLTQNIEKQLGDIDFSSLDEMLKESGEAGNFGGGFESIVKKFLSGEDGDFFANFLEYILSVIFDKVLKFLPYFAIIVSVAIVCSLMTQVMGEKKMQSAMYLVCFAVVAILSLKIVLDLLSQTRAVTNSLTRQMEAIFPLMLTLIIALGGTVSASTFEPLLSILTNGITKLFTSVLLPIFIFCLVFNVLHNLSKDVKLDKFSKFFSSLFGWITGVSFTIFVAFLSIHGLTVSGVDSLSLRTAKFAIKSQVPMIGGFLSDGIGVVLASTNLIKNGVGGAGLILMAFTVFSPIITVLIVGLFFKLASAILEPLSDKGITDFLYSISKTLTMLVVVLVTISVMYLISVGILIGCANVF